MQSVLKMQPFPLAANQTFQSLTHSASLSLCLWLTRTTQNDFKINFDTFDEAHLPLLHKIYNFCDVLVWVVWFKRSLQPPNISNYPF